jgi:transposase InsO family protein
MYFFWMGRRCQALPSLPDGSDAGPPVATLPSSLHVHQLFSRRRSFPRCYGPRYLAQAFEDDLRPLAVRKIRCSKHHPQTNGKLERFHETLKVQLNLLVHTSPEQLRAAMAEFIECYNHRQDHEGVGNVTPADMYYGRSKEILRGREDQKTPDVL